MPFVFCPMSYLKFQSSPLHISHKANSYSGPLFSSPQTLSLPISSFRDKPISRINHNAISPSLSSFSLPPNSPCKHQLWNPRVSQNEASILEGHEEDPPNPSEEFDDLATDGPVYRKTLRLVECSMFAAVAGLAYFLSNSLAIESYVACFFSLPIVISSMRWGIAAGRKTMVATAVLLLTLSGPVKALTYLLMHGLVGLALGTLWRLGVNWSLSIIFCSLVRAMGAMGYVLISSFLIRENILALITINIHASLTYILTAIAVNTIPSMDVIYTIFGTLLLLNCGFFVFLLHILYAVFLSRLGMKSSLALPKWLEKAI
ncbi:uncharacterized protein LOC122064700 [Macadamia integrifolia]|uniref:uncharacterized protein LOC122064700 n=1 Tax=Macadamia integrifolia TaxID=60698 RepID=UPI001C50045C|nr:uncharacterized protein LOC122064700 [Macadamia integrifolia]